MSTCFERHNEDVVLRIRLSPAARNQKVAGVFEDADGISWLKIQVREVPENGKANAALIKFLAKTLGLAKSGIHLESGHTSRRKALRFAYSRDVWRSLQALCPAE